MADPFVAEIRLFSFNFAPTGWAFCNGQVLPLSQNTALFSLLGTTYGGNGSSNFALPNLQGSAPLGFGQGPGLSDYALGQTGGSAAVTLLASEIPAHTHTVSGASSPTGSTPNPTNAAWGTPPGREVPALYATDGTREVAMSTAATATAGGDQPHNNMAPYLAVNFCIALQGVFPPRS